VILNRVRGLRHEKKLREALGRYCDIEVVGAIPDRKTAFIQERHLGLTPVKEDSAFPPVIEEISALLEEHVDLDRVLEIARRAPSLEREPGREETFPTPDVRIGIAMDSAFTFYYPENLAALRRAGAELIPLDTLRDPHLPEVNALYIGGGFPEVLMEKLEKNVSLRGEIRARIEEGMPVYAECGGLMYLGRTITYQDETRSMVGALPLDVTMHLRPMGHGYVILESAGGTVWNEGGAEIRAHEFHHSRVVNLGQVDFAYRMLRGEGVDGKHDGILYRNVLASYAHLHCEAAPGWADRLTALARRYG